MVQDTVWKDSVRCEQLSCPVGLSTYWWDLDLVWFFSCRRFWLIHSIYEHIMLLFYDRDYQAWRNYCHHVTSVIVSRGRVSGRQEEHETLKLQWVYGKIWKSQARLVWDATVVEYQERHFGAGVLNLWVRTLWEIEGPFCEGYISDSYTIIHSSRKSLVME